ncbi:MAG: F0F1 ATP synthase subunit A [Phycisphaeraceae bacterium]|nr:F0F1 ATP synthase subunit A [Phycisphaeraceae bacterium]
MVLGELLPNVNELFEWKGIFGPNTAFEFNKVALMAFVSTIICIALFWIGGTRRKLVPTGVQNVAEAGYLAIEENVSIAAMGDEGRKWTPFFATLFFWIFFINIWSVVPFIQFPATSRLAIPLFLAIVSWMTFIVTGFVKQGPKYFFSNINPSGVPFALKFLVIPIEFFSKYLLRPLTLAVRLFANMTAGHVLLAIFAIMTNELLVKHNSGLYQVIFSPLPFLGLVAFTAFEILVAVLQAYIFTILTAVYINESVHPEH